MAAAEQKSEAFLTALRNIHKFGDVKASFGADAPMEAIHRLQAEKEGYAFVDYDLGKLRLTDYGRRTIFPSTEPRSAKTLAFPDRRALDRTPRER